MGKKIEAPVLESYYGKSLVMLNDIYYIVRGTFNKGEVIVFDSENAIQMPSYLFAIAAMNEEDLDNTFDFIKSNWFGGIQN